MHNFVRVTKDNNARDRGFIALDAICAVFEDQEANNTQIMTMDGMWYDVVDGIDQIYSVCNTPNKPRGESNTKIGYLRKRRMQSSALSERSVSWQEQIQGDDIRIKKTRSLSKGKIGWNSEYKTQDNQISSDFSPSGEEWRCYHKPKDENYLTENVSKPDTADSRQSAKRVVSACGL